MGNKITGYFSKREVWVSFKQRDGLEFCFAADIPVKLLDEGWEFGALPRMWAESSYLGQPRCMWLQVDVLVTTAGGVEEDLIKCLAPTYLGEFSLRGKELRENGINRWGA